MRMGGMGSCMGRFFARRGMHDKAAKVDGGCTSFKPLFLPSLCAVSFPSNSPPVQLHVIHDY